MPHDQLWTAVNKRLATAEFFLSEMSRDLVPPSESDQYQPHIAAILATGVIVDHPWEKRFYAHFDAFLAMSRSVPEIIKCLFGFDAFLQLKPWFATLDPKEQARRKAFQSQFETVSKPFVAIPLSSARNVTLHRTGVPPVEVRITGRWGTIYVGTPVQGIPQSELLPDRADTDPALLAAAMEAPPPITPRANDFSLLVTTGGQPSKVALFPECQSFLESCRKLVADAQKISQVTHGSAPLTAPPV